MNIHQYIFEVKRFNNQSFLKANLNKSSGSIIDIMNVKLYYIDHGTAKYIYFYISFLIK